ncbi:hypothetical protein B0H17DRAFT_219200 [Mycena rosella]|uniref:ceramidase n=1 Tax=Mycena rosella TaxID=1033263 RepID=A0AAD7B5K1_MYCRO|nr:hypothetical protein B0H17DRAFT_722114 [Mycena rosella]KAJ7668913.1 hypothetical protein B0H17DRAFT_219200 [Mycena rosella]
MQGYATLPYAWSLSTVDIQMFKVGNLVMLIILEELTIMAGRRLPREHLRALHHHARGVRCPAVRGASTIFGPSSTSTSTRASCLSSWTHPLSRTPELTSGALSLTTGVVFDAAPIGKSFGQVLINVVTNVAYKAGDTVVAQFVSANP